MKFKLCKSVVDMLNLHALSPTIELRVGTAHEHQQPVPLLF
jgi:hypothetical protein